MEKDPPVRSSCETGRTGMVLFTVWKNPLASEWGGGSMNEPTCDVEGCSDEAVAKLHDVNDADDRRERCRQCLLFDLGI